MRQRDAMAAAEASEIVDTEAARLLAYRRRPAQTVAEALSETVLAARAFLDGIVVYVLSREWKDLLSVYVLQLQPRPHCSGVVGRTILGWAYAPSFKGPKCSPAASAFHQAAFACGFFAVAALSRRAAEIAGLVTAVRMAGMCVGWSIADAVIKLQLELDVLNTYRGLYGLFVTFVCALVLAASTECMQLAHGHRHGTGCAPACATAASSLVSSTHALLASACQTIVIASCISLNAEWVDEFSVALAPTSFNGGDDSLPVGPNITPVRTDVWRLICYAIGVTALASGAATIIVSCRHRASSVAIVSAGVHEEEAASEDAPRQGGSGLWAQLSRLAEGACGGLAGAAWTSAIFSSSSSLSLAAVLRSAAMAVGLTLLALLWLAVPAARAKGLPPDAEAWRQLKLRTAWLEQYALFLTAACAWFVGWAWVTLLRDVQVEQEVARVSSAQAVVGGLFVLHGTSPWLGILLHVGTAERLAWRGEVLSALVFGPLLTVAMLFVRNGGLRAVQAMLHFGEMTTKRRMGPCCPQRTA